MWYRLTQDNAPGTYENGTHEILWWKNGYGDFFILGGHKTTQLSCAKPQSNTKNRIQKYIDYKMKPEKLIGSYLSQKYREESRKEKPDGFIEMVYRKRLEYNCA
tara:strand:- start:74 stop:385 length:312 start_codon:yes stop_codon:yes gene_type:complete